MKFYLLKFNLNNLVNKMQLVVTLMKLALMKPSFSSLFNLTLQ